MPEKFPMSKENFKTLEFEFNQVDGVSISMADAEYL